MKWRKKSGLKTYNFNLGLRIEGDLGEDVKFFDDKEQPQPPFLDPRLLSAREIASCVIHVRPLLSHSHSVESATFDAKRRVENHCSRSALAAANMGTEHGSAPTTEGLDPICSINLRWFQRNEGLALDAWHALCRVLAPVPERTKSERREERRAVTRDEGRGEGARLRRGQEQLKVWDPFSSLRTMGER